MISSIRKIRELLIPQATLTFWSRATHYSLFYTNLLATLDMFRLNSASLTFGTTDEGNQFRSRQKLTRNKFAFRCTRENPMPKHRWDSYLRHVKAMVVDHFIRSTRHQSKNLPKHYEVLFTGSEAPAGSTELSKVQRDKRKLGTMCHALIAEHMFTPNLDTYTGDDAIIETLMGNVSHLAKLLR